MTERERRLQEIRERAENASHGPWEVNLTLYPLNELGNQQRKGREDMWTYVEQPEYTVRTVWVHGQAQAKMPIAMISVGPYFEGRNEKLHWLSEPHDPEFIAHAREDVPWLLTEVEQLEEALGSVESLNDELREILVYEGYNVEELEHYRKAAR